MLSSVEIKIVKLVCIAMDLQTDSRFIKFFQFTLNQGEMIIFSFKKSENQKKVGVLYFLFSLYAIQPFVGVLFSSYVKFTYVSVANAR